MDSLLQGCAGSTEAVPDDCPMATFVFGDYRDLQWTIDTQPTVEISSDGTGWTTTGGTATARYELRGYFDSGYSPEVDSVSLYPMCGSLSVREEAVTVTMD